MIGGHDRDWLYWREQARFYEREARIWRSWFYLLMAVVIVYTLWKGFTA